MTKLTFNIFKHKLTLTLSRKRKLKGEVTLLDEVRALSGIRSGSRVSRVFRHIIDRINIKAILGGNIAFVVLSTSIFAPVETSLAQVQLTETQTAEATILAPVETKLTTEVVSRYPVDRVILNQGFTFYHPGLDLGGNAGEPVYPIENGTVEVVEASRFGYGNSVVVAHKNELKSRYAHLRKVMAKTGQEVNTKTQIGTLGSTGHSTGPHLHLEIEKNGRRVNPQTVLGPIHK